MLKRRSSAWHARAVLMRQIVAEASYCRYCEKEGNASLAEISNYEPRCISAQFLLDMFGVCELKAIHFKTPTPSPLVSAAWNAASSIQPGRLLFWFLHFQKGYMFLEEVQELWPSSRSSLTWRSDRR